MHFITAFQPGQSHLTTNNLKYTNKLNKASSLVQNTQDKFKLNTTF